ncbi:MAG: hypothetical protein ABSH11_11375 [Verrucomicrobiota bacterium]|jgi:hypothetical protein
MSASADKTFAWEPLTPRGVAAFAHARLSRLLLVQFVVASLAAAAVVWFLSDGCFPTVRAAIRHLPATGTIRSGRLDWSSHLPQILAEGRFLAFIVDPNHSGQIHSPADVQFEFGRETLRVFSLLGYAEWNYPSDWIIAFNRTELEPLWGAWEPEWLAITVLAVVAGLMLLWAALATVYFLPAWLIGFFANRNLSFRGSWKLAGAALMPGALLLTAAVVLYDFAALDLVQFCFIFSAHFALGWVYLFLGQLFLPRIDSAPPKGNPFVPC